MLADNKQMIYNNLKSSIKNLLSLLFIAVLVVRCANPVPPTGGPIDKDPPKVLHLLPPNKTTNFKSPSIEIHFDEYIQFQSSGGAVIISPPLDPMPQMMAKGKKLMIDFEKNLLPNTTYTINFGSSIKDVNEGNILDNFVYIFSTGPYLDSLVLSGKVINAFDHKGVDGVVVALYPADWDSVLVKRKPYYFTKTDPQGNFRFNYLKDASYQIAALDDKNLNYIFDQPSEMIAFQDNILVLDESMVLSDPLILFKNEEKIKVTETKSRKSGLLTFAFNRAVDEILVDANVFNEKDIAFFNQTNDTLFYWYNQPSDTARFYLTINDEFTDTIKVKLTAIDTVQKFEMKVNNNQVPENIGLRLNFNRPVVSFEPDSIILKDTAETELPFVVERISFFEFSIKASYRSGQTYSLEIPEGAFTDYTGRLNVQKFVAFSAIDKEDPPNIFIDLKNQKEGIFYIQLLTEDKKELERRVIGNQKNISFLNQKPGKYFVRIFQDLNANGKWDTGKFGERRQPEPTVYFSPSIELRPNWDQELQIEIK
jgi:hypothetical protein